MARRIPRKAFRPRPSGLAAAEGVPGAAAGRRARAPPRPCGAQAGAHSPVPPSPQPETWGHHGLCRGRRNAIERPLLPPAQPPRAPARLAPQCATPGLPRSHLEDGYNCAQLHFSLGLGRRGGERGDGGAAGGERLGRESERRGRRTRPGGRAVRASWSPGSEFTRPERPAGPRPDPDPGGRGPG